MSHEEKFKSLMTEMVRIHAEKLAAKPAKIEMKTNEVLAVLTLVEDYLNEPANRSSNDEFTELLRNAHMRLSVSLNVQQ